MIRIYYIYMFITAFLGTSILIPYVARLAVKVGGIDHPDERKVHQHATPRLGGVAVFCAFLFTVIFFCRIDQQIKGFLAGAIFIFLTGVSDDLAGLSPRQKFFGEFIAVMQAVLIGNVCIRHLGDPFGTGTIELGWLALPFTVLAIVGLINAINLLDGMDGVAGTVCAIACVSFAVIAYTSGNTSLFPLVIALLGALIGFLLYNHYPAQIFLGDGGSLLLGYCMGIFSAWLATGGKQPASPFLPLIILGLPILDTLVVMANRWRSGRSLFLADRTHIHHRLLQLGIGPKFTALTVIGIAYPFNLIAIFGRNLSDQTLLILFLATTAAVYGILFGMTAGGWFSRLEATVERQLGSTWNQRTTVRIAQGLLAAIKCLLAAILLLPLFLSVEAIVGFSKIALAAALASVGISLVRRSWYPFLLQGNIYFSGALMIFMLEYHGRKELLLGVPLHFVSHGLFLFLLLCVGAKVLLRRRASILIVSRFDYLLMLIVLSTPLLPLSFTSQFHLLTVAVKLVILFAAFKLALPRQLRRPKVATVAELQVGKG